MSTLHLGVDIDGDRGLSRKIRGLTRAVSDRSSTMEQRLSTEGGHEPRTDDEGYPNPPWAALSARRGQPDRHGTRAS